MLWYSETCTLVASTRGTSMKMLRDEMRKVPKQETRKLLRKEMKKVLTD
jgi:hypothetical protein